jgi:hypothetical protein
MFEYSNNIHLPHLSPSTINSFITNRYGFYRSKVIRAAFKGSPPMCRGSAVESCVNYAIEKEGNVTTEEIQELAITFFKSEMENSNLSWVKYIDVMNTVPGLACLAVNTYMEICNGMWPISQQKVSARIDGIERDIMGYTDYTFIDRCVRDCKVVSQTPSKLSQSYIIAGSFYKLCTGLPVVFDFFVNNKKPAYKSICLTDDDYVFGLKYMTLAAKRIEEIERCDNPNKMMHLIMSFPDLSSFYSPEERVEAAASIGIVL